MPWITVADSDIGGREEQQDRYLVVNSDDNNSHLLVVADGAGGHKAGALAAKTAINCIRENLEFLWPSEDPEAFINKLFIECNERVLAIGDGELACSTLVLVFIKHDQIFWGHIGDSRLYLVRDGNTVFRTTDHTVLELQRQQAAQGVESPINAAANELYMCLGAVTDISPEVSCSMVREADTLLLCSDGFWGQLDTQPALADLSANLLSAELIKKWVGKAKASKANNSDNITVIAARFTDKPRFALNPFEAIARLFKR